MINQNQETNSLSASDIKPESVPALDLSFDWVKDVLSKQCADVDAIDNKAITLFSVATAIVGLGAWHTYWHLNLAAEIFYIFSTGVDFSFLLRSGSDFDRIFAMGAHFRNPG